MVAMRYAQKAEGPSGMSGWQACASLARCARGTGDRVVRDRVDGSLRACSAAWTGMELVKRVSIACAGCAPPAGAVEGHELSSAATSSSLFAKRPSVAI